MKTWHFWLSILFSLFWVKKTTAQSPYYTEALLYSQHIHGGTARFQSLGGANIALGGDISSALMNPAGLGFCRNSEASFSLAYGHYASSSQYKLDYPNNPFPNNPLIRDSKGNMNFNHLGFIFKSGGETDKFYGGAFAITLTRIADFHSRFSYEGTNDETSIVDFFLEKSQGIKTGYFEEQGKLGINDPLALSYYTYLINPDSMYNNNTAYYSFLPILPTQQKEEVISRGAHYEWSFAYGGNFKDVLYFGVKLGVQSLNRNVLKQYREAVRAELVPPNVRIPLSNLLFEEDISTDGSGVNASIGLIARPIDALRIGFTATTPTALRLSEVYKASLVANYNNYRFDNNTILRKETASTDPITTKYTVVSPARIGVGGSIFIGKRGFISADIEYVDYTTLKIRNADFETSEDNALFRTDLSERLNYRLGAEMRVKELRFRAGFAHYPSPVAMHTATNARNFYSVGAGMRKENFYADFMLQATSKNTSYYTPYTLKELAFPEVDIDSRRIRTTFTLGFVF